MVNTLDKKIVRSKAMKRIVLLWLISLLPALLAADEARPNVLFISIDDLNDWVGVFGGNPQMKTPNMDRFANEGSVVFQNAHCAGPVCGPSRSALMSGFRPDRTGAYGNSQNMLKSPLVQEFATLPEYFSQHGYRTISRGKIFHSHNTANGVDRGQWAWDEYDPGEGGGAVDKSRYYSRRNGIYGGKQMENSPFSAATGSEFGWGPTVGGKEDTPDYKTALWAADLLQEPSEKPFFLAVGIFRPHLPWYVPQEYFDRYPLEDVVPPEVDPKDLEDILNRKGEVEFGPTDDYLWASQSEELLKRATRAYMACSSYADDCVGLILDGLAKSPYRDNTIVVIWGDHGWHLGEKLRYRKATLWAESTRMPLTVRLPEMNTRQDCLHAVNLLDLHQTLVELCGLPIREAIDSRSLAPLLENPQRDWPYPSVTTAGLGNHSVMYEDWHYIQRANGTNELYHLKTDPLEHRNLVRSDHPTALDVMAQLKRFIPVDPFPDLPKNDPNHKESGLDLTLKGTRDLSRLK
jgi:arylsulfatase A-like enzyme